MKWIYEEPTGVFVTRELRSEDREVTMAPILTYFLIFTCSWTQIKLSPFPNVYIKSVVAVGNHYWSTHYKYRKPKRSEWRAKKEEHC